MRADVDRICRAVTAAGAGRSRRRAALWLLIAVLAGVSPALIVLLLSLREPHSVFAQMERRTQELEEACRDRPADRAAGLHLAEAYARMVVYVRLVRRRAGRNVTPASAGSFGAELKAAQRAAERGIPAQQGEALARRLLAAPGLALEEEAALHVLLGYFLLHQERPAQAEAEARRASELDPGDVRPHLLSAAVCEERGQCARAIEEERMALSKLSAWTRGDRSPLQSALWGLEPGFVNMTSPRADWRQFIAAGLEGALKQDLLRLQTMMDAAARGTEAKAG